MNGIKNPNVVILKDEEKGFKFKSISLDSFNENYHKNVSNEHNVYFIIPVTPLSNIYMILDRNSMPKVFTPMRLSYTLEVLAMDPAVKYNMEMVYKQDIRHDVITPHDLFTLIYNLSELTLFNTLFNDDRNNTGTNKKAYIFNVFKYQISMGYDEMKTEEITGIPALINNIFARYNMMMSNTNTIECFLNSDGSSYYSDPSEIHGTGASKMIGRMNDAKTSIMAVPLHYVQVPVYTFIPEQDSAMIESVNEYYYTGRGVVAHFMGNKLNMPLQMKTFNTSAEMTADVARDLVWPTRVSIVHISDLIDFVIYLKLAPSLMRVAYTLTKLQISDAFDKDVLGDDVPCFRYEFYVSSELGKNTKYYKDYMITSEDKIQLMDPYSDFIDDVTDAWMPF